MITIAPSILAADFSDLLSDIKEVERAGAQLLHVDVMDGHFVPNISIGAPILKSLQGKVQIPFDVHLMTERPEQTMNYFLFENTASVTVQAEACTHLHRVIQQIHSHGRKAGVALNPSTLPQTLDYVLEEIDFVLVMSVNPGFGGQAFIPSALKKIAWLREEIDRRCLKTGIQVDGGIHLGNVEEVVKAGADMIVAGSAIFESGDICAATKKFLAVKG